MVITSVNSYAQISPQAIPTPTDTVPVGDNDGTVMLTSWYMRGNKATLATGSSLGTQNAYPIYFITNNTKRMIIDSSGNVGVEQIIRRKSCLSTAVYWLKM